MLKAERIAEEMLKNGTKKAEKTWMHKKYEAIHGATMPQHQFYLMPNPGSNNTKKYQYKTFK